jgi:hypothetical protein
MNISINNRITSCINEGVTLVNKKNIALKILEMTIDQQSKISHEI